MQSEWHTGTPKIFLSNEQRDIKKFASNYYNCFKGNYVKKEKNIYNGILKLSLNEIFVKHLESGPQEGLCKYLLLLLFC